MIDFFRSIYYWFSTGLVSILCLIFYPCKVYGRENVPRKGAVILASNHISNLDPVLIPVVCPRQLRFIAKESLFKIPILGALIRCGGGIPVRRGTADRKALGEALDELKRGYALLMFPQGTRGGTKAQAGVAFLAATAGVPVIPIYIEGMDQLLPKGAAFPRRSAVRVVFGKPITISKDIAYDSAAENIMATIWSLEKTPAARS
ncbi:MAG: 1-acyl-sn-glycerol-3-phosphate acyltransferase [Candidatus Omnitrophica bacterium]|nr:1-acyl-sn-glycerol-3-phosphate acyltransferase [Candidatus Omnitrophota bacterium]